MNPDELWDWRHADKMSTKRRHEVGEVRIVHVGQPSSGSTSRTRESDIRLRERPSLRELEVLRAMIAVKKTTVAAQSLGLSQPAVSRAIASLEARTGQALFFRDAGRLIPTAYAMALHTEVSPIFDVLDRLDNWPNARPQNAVVKIIAVSTLAHGFLCRVLPKFKLEEPETVFQVEIARSPEAVSAVADRAVDLGLVDQTPDHAGVDAEVFRRGVAHVAMRSDHALASSDVLSATDLSDQPFIALARRLPARSLIDRAFADAGVEPPIVAESTTTAFALELAREGMGVTVIDPFPFDAHDQRDIVFRRFRPNISFETSLIYSSVTPPSFAVRRLIDYIRREHGDDHLLPS